MSTAISVYHGAFGRAALYHLDRPLTMHAHREGHLVFYVDASTAVLTVNGVAQRCDAGPPRRWLWVRLEVVHLPRIDRNGAASIASLRDAVDRQYRR